MKVNLCEGIVNKEIFKEFEDQKGVSLFNHASNCCNIDDFLAIAYVLCPDIIDINGYIFVSDLFDAQGEEAIERIKELEQQFENDKRKIEQWVNSRSLGDFFIGACNASMDNEIILEQFGKVLIYNWSRRLKDLFPERNIVVEIGNEIMGELGLTVTMYEQM